MEVKKKHHPVHKHIIVYSDGRVFSKISNKFLRQRLNEFGYLITTITTSQNNYKSYRVHRLVAETYLPNPENKREVNHIDGDKANNNVDNLEWSTSKENKKHARDNGYYDKTVGESHHLTYITEKDVRAICELLQDGRRNKEVADHFGFPLHLVTSIKCRRSWVDISKEYDFSVKRQHRKSEKEIRKICELIVQGYTNKEIEDLTGTPRKEVYKIRAGYIFSSISKEYDF